MSDTPETDALVNSINSDSDIIRHEYDFVEMTEHARRLERERDEAIRARDVALKAAHTYDEAHTKSCNGWAQAERERDAALDKISELKGVIQALRSNLRETSRETK
jgi:hypothetical protein